MYPATFGAKERTGLKLDTMMMNTTECRDKNSSHKQLVIPKPPKLSGRVNF